MEGIWELSEVSGKNPQVTSAFFGSYDSDGFSPEEVTARESGQNAIDAGKDNASGVTQLVFQELKAAGENNQQLVDSLKLKQILQPRLGSFSRDRDRPFANSIRELFSNDNLSALLIRDYKTCGLGGKWGRYEKNDHFSRLLCGLNLDDKADDDPDSGGSYGLGKTAYARSSKIHTVAYHSAFEASEESEGHHRRLMVSGVFPKHEYQGKSYSGFAYYGKEDPTDRGSTLPFVNNEAEEIWGQFSQFFNVDLSRKDSDYGTDILIFMCSLGLSELKKAVEDYYFPALVENKLSVKFIRENCELDFPKVDEREDLDQFVRLHRLAKKQQRLSKDQEKKLEVSKLRNIKQKKPGLYAFEAAEEDEQRSKRVNCVAITRDTGMIINYLKMGSDRFEPAVGVFIADPEIKNYLVASENSAHSRWDEQSNRLIQIYQEEGKSVVKRLNSTLRTRFDNFQRKLQPDVESTRTEGGYLSKLLSTALSGPSAGKKPPQQEKNPVSINLTKVRREASITVWNLKVSDNEITPVKQFDLKLFPLFSLAGDTKKVSIKNMIFKVLKEEKVIAEGSNPVLKYKFSREIGCIELDLELANPKSLSYNVECKFEAIIQKDLW